MTYNSESMEIREKKKNKTFALHPSKGYIANKIFTYKLFVRNTPKRKEPVAMNTISKYFLLVVIAILFPVNFLIAQQLKLAFEEVAQSADLVFVGTVEKQNARINESKSMIFTDVVFKDIMIVSATERSVQKDSSVVLLTYAGGHVGDRGITLTDMPEFMDGHSYLIFMYDDGKTYSNPIIGGYQGQYEIVRDAISNESFVLTSGRKAIVQADIHGIAVSDRRVSAIKGGNLIFEEQQSSIQEKAFTQQPIPADSTSSYNSGQISKVAPYTPMRLNEFVNYIKNVTFRIPLERKMLKREGQGSFYKDNGTRIEKQEIKLSESPRVRSSLQESEFDNTNHLQGPPCLNVPSQPIALGPNYEIATRSGTLGACGYQKLNIVMQEVPTSWWSYEINQNCLWTWNQYMDLYRYTASDGTYGYNFTNEYCGWVSDATLNSTYGFHWGSGIAVTISYMGFLQPTCGEIDETDVAWNSAYSWTDNASFAIGNVDVILLRPCEMHELAHTWGEQRGTHPETYDYNYPSVMQSYYHCLVEDGWGIHFLDAYLVRRQYQNQTSILSTKDVGVESYYASNGLINSTTDLPSYYPGQSITMNNVTVENMSYSAVSDFRICFYLSRDRTITTSDYQMGSYWYWPSFSGEGFSIGNYTTQVPSNIPAGTYFIGAIVTINGFANDDYPYNNSTSFFSSVTINSSLTITASAGGGGTISPSGVVTALYDLSKTFNITPNTGYHIANVLVDDSLVGAVTSYTFNNITANHTISASFAINTYTITTSAGSNGTITPSGEVLVNYGTDTTFTITPSTGYHVANVLADGSSVGAVTIYTFNNVTANHTISDSFAINTYTITASAGSNGTITPSGEVSVNYGTDTTFTITPNTNYKVDSVVVDGTKVDMTQSNTFHNVTANHSISVWFGTLTSVSELKGFIPGTYSLFQNYPNPFNPLTTILFAVPSKAYVTLKVFDFKGREIATICSEELSTGTYTRQWNAANLPGGVYFYRLQAGSYTETKKLILLK
jgi:hypothetical protein